MSEKAIAWTADELARFDQLIDMSEARHQVLRIKGRLDLREFVATHGKEKCDAMWTHLQSIDSERSK